MTKASKIVGGILGGLLLLVVIAVLFISLFNWNQLKPTINQRISSELNRPFAIRGDLGVTWERNNNESGWRHWIPWPHIYAQDIMLGNPPDIPAVTMVHLARLDATLSPLSLLTQTVSIPWIKLQQPEVRLTRLANKTNNWTFKLAGEQKNQANSAQSGWSLKMDKILFDRLRVILDDKFAKAQLEVLVDPLGKPLSFNQVAGDKPVSNTTVNPGDYVFGLQATGRYNGEPVTGNGKIGSIQALRDQHGVPFPVQADIRSGHSRVMFTGTLKNPLNLEGIDVRLKLSGHSLSEIYDVTGVLLPKTPPFETDGHLLMVNDPKKGPVFSYQKFKGRIGESDVQGELRYSQGKPRPKLEGDLESDQLRLVDLGPLIGVDDDESKNIQPADKVLPYDRFENDTWNQMDADVRFKGKHIEHSGSLPLSDLTTHIILSNGDLRLQPVKFGMAGGIINATIHLAGDKKPLQGEAKIQARRLQLKQLLPKMESMQKTLGELNGNADIHGQGNSIAALLGSSNGSLKLLMNDGLISRNLMEIVGLNLGNYLVGQLFGDDVEHINCAVASLDLRQGVATPRVFAIDTDSALINITGTTSFASEKFDLTLDPESKGIRIITLRSPLYVRGSFKNPSAGIKVGALIARGAAVAALATLATPAAGLLALVSPSEGSSNQCRSLLGQMKK